MLPAALTALRTPLAGLKNGFHERGTRIKISAPKQTLCMIFNPLDIYVTKFFQAKALLFLKVSWNLKLS